jgi:N-ethylmaleimide reductase
MMDMKKVWDGPLMCNVGLTKEEAKGMLRSGTTDLVCIGRPYISNPDLAERFINNWPLNEDANYETWWKAGSGAKGYTDFPFYKPTEEQKAEES